MRNLEDVPLKYRVVITAGIVLVILLALALFGYLTDRWDAQAQTILQPGQTELQPLALSKYEQHIIELDRAAVDDAYKNQITHLFQTWMKDESGQPKRAETGARQARTAYVRSLDAIEARQRRLEGAK